MTKMSMTQMTFDPTPVGGHMCNFTQGLLCASPMKTSLYQDTVTTFFKLFNTSVTEVLLLPLVPKVGFPLRKLLLSHWNFAMKFAPYMYAL